MPLSSRRRTGDQQSTAAPIHRMREYIGGKEDDDTRNVTDRCAGSSLGDLALHEPRPSILPWYVRSSYSIECAARLSPNACNPLLTFARNLSAGLCTARHREVEVTAATISMVNTC